MLKVDSIVFNPVMENTYIVSHPSGKCAIIDPGCYFPEEQERLSNFISGNSLTPVLLLNTHCHLDHVFGNKYIAETFGLELHIHPEEEKMLEMAPASGLMYNLPFNSYVGKINYLTPGHPILLEDEKINVLFTPGHSPGSVSFYYSVDNFVISGDALFAGSIGRTDLPFGDQDTLLNSIKRELLSLPLDTIVYSGHGPSTTIGEEIKTNPFLN